MGRKFSILVAFCAVLFAAILAGYWDMLDSQKLREVRDQASSSPGASAGSGAGNGAAKPSTTPGAGSQTAATGAPAANAPAGTGGEPASANRSTAADTAASSAPAGARPSVTPSFDVLRIEPDGSAVLAGRASPNSQIRLMDGATAIGTAKTSPEGDFAIVLDERLPAGDHQIRIEADKGDGVKAISEQTAIVSVPKKGAGGELLAMVETPNQPSRIINMPDGRSPQTAADASGAQSAAPAAPAAGTAAEGPAASGGNGAAPSAAASAAPARGAADGQAAVASRGADAAEAPAAAGNPPAPPPFAVEAVEIENGTIYIAGRAPGTAPVRVYVDNKFVGEDKARANGRFLVTAKAPLAVGNHEIRADMIGGDGAVASRVEVPFAKPEGEAMSAIASNDAPPNEGGTNPAEAGRGPSDGASSMSVAPAGQPWASAESRPRTAASDPSAGGGSSPAGEARMAAPADVAPSGSAAEQAPASASNDVAASRPSDAASAEASPAGGSIPPQATQADDGIATVRQAPLEGVHTRVLIRRGDTLWRISRETYGQGRRYTVIYLANGDQIRNPNRIYPGQLFRLPKDDSKAID